MSTDSQILYAVDGSTAFVTLNRPEKRNALGDRLIAELIAALRQADADPMVKVVVISGAGKDFCAGADLSQLEKLAGATVLDNFQDAAKAAELFGLPRKMSKKRWMRHPNCCSRLAMACCFCARWASWRRARNKV